MCAHFMGRRKTCAVPVYVLWVLPPPRLLLPAAARVAMSSIGAPKAREKDWERVPCWVAATMPTGFCTSRGCSQQQAQHSRAIQPYWGTAARSAGFCMQQACAQAGHTARKEC